MISCFGERGARNMPMITASCEPQVCNVKPEHPYPMVGCPNHVIRLTAIK